MVVVLPFWISCQASSILNRLSFPVIPSTSKRWAFGRVQQYHSSLKWCSCECRNEDDLTNDGLVSWWQRFDQRLPSTLPWRMPLGRAHWLVYCVSLERCTNTRSKSVSVLWVSVWDSAWLNDWRNQLSRFTWTANSVKSVKRMRPYVTHIMIIPNIYGAYSHNGTSVHTIRSNPASCSRPVMNWVNRTRSEAIIWKITKQVYTPAKMRKPFNRLPTSLGYLLFFSQCPLVQFW